MTEPTRASWPIVFVGFGAAWILATTIATVYLWNRNVDLELDSARVNELIRIREVFSARIETEVKIIATMCTAQIQNRADLIEAYLKRIGAELPNKPPPPLPTDEIVKK